MVETHEIKFDSVVRLLRAEQKTKTLLFRISSHCLHKNARLNVRTVVPKSLHIALVSVGSFQTVM